AGDARADISGSWGAGIPSVRVVVQPSRIPVLILAAGGALALIIASVALLLGRLSSRHDEVLPVAGPSAQPATATVTVGPAPPPRAPPLPAPPPGGPPPRAPRAAPPPPPGGGGGTPPPLKPLHPGPSADPGRTPSPGDPFGEGRQ